MCRCLEFFYKLYIIVFVIRNFKCFDGMFNVFLFRNIDLLCFRRGIKLKLRCLNVLELKIIILYF